MKRRSLAAAVLIIYIVLLIPAGTAFADDDYPDHNSNDLAVFSWINAQTNTMTDYTRTGVFMDDIELRYDNTVSATYSISYHTAQTIHVPDYIDCVDFDFTGAYYSGGYWGDSTRSLYVLKIRVGSRFRNINYIEFYAQTNYRSGCVLYQCFDGGFLYVVLTDVPTPINPATSENYTLRVHLYPGGDCYIDANDIDYDILSYRVEISNLSSNDAFLISQCHYLAQLLKELEDLNAKSSTPIIPDFDFDLSDIEQLITNIQNFLFNETGFTRFYLRPYDSGYGAYEQAVYKIPRDYGYAADNMHSNQRQAIVQQGIDNPYYTSIATYTSVVMLGFYITSPCKYVSINIPLGSWSSFNRTTDIKMKYCIAPHTKSTSEFNTYIDNKVISFDKYYSNYATYDAHYDFDNVPYLSVNLYIPDTYYNLRDYCFYIFIESTTPAAQSFYLKQYYALSGKTYYIDVYGDNMFAHSAIDTMLLRNIYDAILGISIPSLPDYPTGPSAPNEETNIYDIDIEFNSQVGDIHAFENVYISMFADYNSDFTPSQYGNFDDSITATFTTMNGLISDFYGSIFDTEEDEEDNVINHLSLGLFIIIPIIAFIVLALFRRVTA